MLNRENRHCRWGAAFCLALIGFILPAKCDPPAEVREGGSVVLSECRQRVNFTRNQMPEITRCAEAIAKQWVEHRDMLLRFYYGAGHSQNFTLEQWSRAGGLDNVQASSLRMDKRTKNDVFVFGQRSWETGVDDLRALLAEAKKEGWTTIVFAPRKGMPEGLPIDYLIDDGASSGSEDDAPMNEIANVINGWVWNCELTSALTRLGWRPAVLKGMVLPGATAHNKTYQHASPELFPCDQAIPAGELGNSYLAGIGKIIAELDTPIIRKQISMAARYAADTIVAGHDVWAMSYTHFLNGTVNVGLKSPMKGVVLIGGAYEDCIVKNVKPDDLVFFFGEWTLNTTDTDFLAILRKTKARYIPSYRMGDEKFEQLEMSVNMYDKDTHDALMILDQPWPFDNAIVPIPFPPGKMTASSGVCAGLLFRMLDRSIAKNLVSKTTAVSR